MSAHARQLGDTVTDRLAAALDERVLLHAATAMLGKLGSNSAELPIDAPPRVAAWLQQARELPAWARLDRLRRAQDWADERLPLIVTALFCASMPTTYAAARGARVVHTSGRLKHDVDRRVHETGAFILDVLRPNGFAPGGRAIIASCQVRLLHAFVRRRVGRPSQEMPINQEDLVGTMLSFSIVVVDALRKMGVTVSQAEEHDYFHLWRVVGALIGIEDALLPLNAKAARATARRIGMSELKPSPEGRELAEALFARIDAHLPSKALHGLPKELSAHLLDPQARDALDLRRDPTWLVALPRGGRELKMVARGVAAASTRLGRPLVDQLLAHKLGGRPVTYAPQEVPHNHPPPRRRNIPLA